MLEISRRAKAFQLITGQPPDEVTEFGLAEKTLLVYASAIRRFIVFCTERGEAHLPARIETVKSWLASLQKSGFSGETIKVYLTAISQYHEARGFLVERRLISSWLKGLRVVARRPKRAEPLLIEALQGILAMLDPDKAADARDGALLALGFANALRRGELVGLDWRRPGALPQRGTGVLRMLRDEIIIELISSKTSRAESVFQRAPESLAPGVRYWMGAWIGHLKPEPGEPVFRPVTRGGVILSCRLSTDSMSAIVRKRVAALEIAKGGNEAEARWRAEGYSGHSLRRGYGTSAAMREVPEYFIRKHMRHSEKSTVTAGYIDEAAIQLMDGSRGMAF